MRRKEVILHICERSTFIENAISNFEKLFPGQNFFLINTHPGIVFNHKGNFDENNPAVCLAEYGSDSYSSVFEDELKRSFLVIFHNLGHSYKRRLISQIEGHVPMHAILWGWEIFNAPRFNHLNLEQKTLEYVKSRKIRWKHRLIYFIRSKMAVPELESLKKMNTVSTILKSEYDYLKLNYSVSADYLPFNYSKIAFLFNEEAQNPGLNISIGNSATYANNHLDALQYIDKTRIAENSKVYVPLSYGDDQQYKNQIIQNYQDFFGSSLRVLDTFLPLERFNSIIKSCGFVIMNHVRQQALGNVFLCLINGGKVFLNKRGFVYKELNQLGIRVYTMEDFNTEYPHPEAKEVAMRNRKIIIGLRNQEMTEKHIMNLVNTYRQIEVNQKEASHF
jgi:dTDP-N-acetylfucosamine:lipid II N-acetylfucosaminyltransferase